MYTYAGSPAGLNKDLTAVEVHHLMKSPTLLARRFKSLVDEHFIADFLLTGRYQATGGAIAYPAKDLDIYPDGAPEAINPGAQYPLVQMDAGQLAIAHTAKEGFGTHVFDEEIARTLINPVNDAFTFLVNGIVRQVDSTALAAITSKVTETQAATKAWTGGTGDDNVRGIVTSIQAAKAKVAQKKLGLNVDTIVLSEAQYEGVMAELLLAGFLPREANNPLVEGAWPKVLGLTWVTSPHVPFTDPLLVDRAQLGGMADENIASPEFTTVDNGVELASTRITDRDGYLIRARRVTVPIVLRPDAGIRITGTDLS